VWKRRGNAPATSAPAESPKSSVVLWNIGFSLRNEQLRGTLNYRNYELVTSVVQRLTETPRGLPGSGTAEIPSGNPGMPNLSMPYEYYVGMVSLIQDAAGAFSVQIGEFNFATSLPAPPDRDRAKVQTALNLRDGEKVVVGTATMRNRALVVVLTAKLVK